MAPKTIGVSRGMGDFKGMKPMAPMLNFEQQQQKSDDRLKGWVAQVGEARADEAWAMLKVGNKNEVGQGSTTLPELLTEVWLRQRNIRYITQVDLGWARPDFALFDVLPSQILVWRVQGDYWHKGSQGKDAGQKTQLLGTTVRGLPVGRVNDLWEKDIYEGNAIFERALVEETV